MLGTQSVQSKDEETSVAGNAARLPGYFLIASDRTIVADDCAKGRYRAECRSETK